MKNKVKFSSAILNSTLLNPFILINKIDYKKNTWQDFFKYSRYINKLPVFGICTVTCYIF